MNHATWFAAAAVVGVLALIGAAIAAGREHKKERE